jgi:hypothetical protein
LRAAIFGLKPCAVASIRIFSLVRGFTRDEPLNARDTVPAETPANRAISEIVRARASMGMETSWVLAGRLLIAMALFQMH